MEEAKRTISVMDGQILTGQAQGTSAAQKELTFADSGEGESGDEQMDAAPEGTAEADSKDKSNTADTGKSSGPSKPRKRTKTGCLSKSQRSEQGSPARLI